MANMAPPIIILGTHRSGTSMLAGILRDHGIFIGNRLDRHNESTFVQRVNNKLLKSLGASWDKPMIFKEAVDNDENGKKTSRNLKLILGSPLSIEYWGFSKYFYSNLRPIRWGWKDPRTSVTLPFWLEMFPEAKIIRIIRNGVDVANSLYKRELDFDKKIEWRRRSDRCLELYECFQLWKEYMSLEDNVMRNVPECRKFTCRYEDLLDPDKYLFSDMGKFLGIDLPAKPVDSIKLERRYAFLSKPNAKELYTEYMNDSMMIKYGYDHL